MKMPQSVRERLSQSVALRQSGIRLFVATSFYCICLVIAFHQNILTITTHLIGPPEDNMTELWNIWYVQRLISLDIHDWFFTELLGHPEGASLLYHGMSYTNLALIRLIRWGAQLPPTIPVLVGLQNIVLLSTFCIAGMTAYLLTYHLTRNFLASLVGGYIFAFSPFHFAHSLHHMHVATIQYIPLFVLCVLRFEETKSPYYGIGAVLWFLLSGLASFYYLFYNGMFLVFLYLYRAFEARKLIIRGLLIQYGAIIAATLLILSPLLVMMIRVSSENPGSIYPTGHKTYVADLIGFIFPHPYHMAANYFSWVHERLKGNAWEMSVYLGIFNIGLLVWAFRSRLHKSDALLRLSVWGMLFFALFAGGRFLRILGVGVPVFLPTAVLEYLPLFGMIRTPSRAIVYTYLFLAIAVARIMPQMMGMRRANSNIVGVKRWAGLIPMAMVPAIWFDFLSINKESTPVVCPPAYDIVAKGDPSAAILNLPLTNGGGNRAMMYQAVCLDRPVVHATVARKVKPTLSDRLETMDLAEWRPVLKSAHVEFIVVHTAAPSFKTSAIDLEDYKQHFRMVFRDETETVYRVE